MKTVFKYVIIGLLLGSFFFPIINATASIEPKQTTRHFRVGTTTAPSYNWDIPIATAGQAIGVFTPGCLEPLVGLSDDYDRGLSEGVYKADTYIPVLATSWTIDFWPEEMNNAPSGGFINRGGVANMTLRLRENVTFHDGSAWNATVAKWNIDRAYIITGNLTGNGDLTNKDTYWLKANEWTDYYTPGWNMSSYGETGAYGYYGIYSNPSEATKQKYPSVKQVVITDDQPNGGEIRIEWNDFNTVGMTGVGLISYISMATYGDYWDKPIRGYDISDPLPHLVGTGPYIYGGFDDSGSPGGGTLVKNYEYWNRTALEADGWFDADYINILTWPQGTFGIESRNTALMTHALDYALDYHWTPVDYEDVMNEPRIDYIERPVMDQLGTISLNAINETWWAWPGYREIANATYPTPYNNNDNVPNGVPRAMRKAMSYAFDYDTYLNVGMDHRYVRSSSIGVNNIYYNASIPIAYYNVTIARNALLNDAYFGPLCTANLLDESSTDLEWQNVANSVGGKTPLWVLDFYWDDQYQIFKNLFQTNLEDIGVTLKDPTGSLYGNKVTDSIWAHLGYYWAGGFPVFSAQAWPLDYAFPSKTPEGVTEMYFSDPSNGIWRTNPGDYWLFDWFPWWNLHFGYNDTVDGWIKRIFLSNETSKQEWYNKLQDNLQNYQYNGIFVGQHKQGACVWKDWEISTFWSSLSYHLTRYVGFGEEYPEIPGFLTGILTGISILTTVGLIYAVQRKTRFK